MPITAHVALDKGARWMGIEVRHAPLAADYRADVDARWPHSSAPTRLRWSVRQAITPWSHQIPSPNSARWQPTPASASTSTVASEGTCGRSPRTSATGAGVGLPGGGSHLYLGRHPQVRICAQGRPPCCTGIGPSVRSSTSPIRTGPGACISPRIGRFPFGWSHRLHVGRHGHDGSGRLPEVGGGHPVHRHDPSRG